MPQVPNGKIKYIFAISLASLIADELAWKN
jgi:hypothetical protein